jgi:DNA-binding CsgD family transcriptional regulator
MLMRSDLLRRLSAARAEVRRLENALASELAGLPPRYGFPNVAAFVRAVKVANQGALKGSRRRTQRSRRRSRAIITNGIRKAVIGLVKTGKTEGEIARMIGISPASVHNIKRSAGLVRHR